MIYVARACKWPADKVERWPIDKLILNARNARTQSDEQVDQIAASIHEWGWTTPVLVTEQGMIIAGHGRVRAARKLGLREVPVMVATGWTKAQIQAYALADNKLALECRLGRDMLALEIAELQEIGFDLDLIGFSIDEIAALGAQCSRGADRSGRRAGAASRSCIKAWRCLAARPAQAAMRRQHGGGRRRRKCSAPCGRISWSPILPMASITIQLGERPLASSRTSNAWARSPTMIGRTGARPGRCFQVRSPTSGTPAVTPARCRSRSRPSALMFARRSSGPRIGLR